MSRDIVKIWMAKFGEQPVICKIHQVFLPPKICTICYLLIIVMPFCVCKLLLCRDIAICLLAIKTVSTCRRWQNFICYNHTTVAAYHSTNVYNSAHYKS